MFSNEKPKESICFKLENESKKKFLEKTKKSEIIQNNNTSLFLKKIISVKNKDLNNKYFHNLDHSSDLKNTRYLNNNMRKTNTNNRTSFFKKDNLLIDFNISPTQNYSNINIYSPYNISQKIYVNKNKNLGYCIQKDKERIDDESNIFYNNPKRIIKQKIIKKINSKNNNHYINTELSASSLYKNKFIRKPVVIKFENGFNINSNSIYNNSNIFNNSCTSTSKNKDTQDEKEEEENKMAKKKEKVKTDLRIKPYIFYEKKKEKSELYRNFKDLEEKSKEICKRKTKKNLSVKTFNFKKDTDLVDVRQSFEFIKNSKSRNKDKKISNDKKKRLNKINKRNNLLNCNKNILFNSSKLNNREKKLFNINDNKIKENNYSQENIYNSEEKSIDNNKYYINKNINININNNVRFKSIYDAKNKIENNLNTENKCKIQSLNINFSHDLNKDSINENISNKNNEKNNNKSNYYYNINNYNKKDHHYGNKTPFVRKKFIEDYSLSENMTNLPKSYFSKLILSKNRNNRQIKVNKKTPTTNISRKKIKKLLPSILEEEEKIKIDKTKNKEINLNIINGIKKIQKIIKSKDMDDIKVIFKILFHYYEQPDTCSNTFHNSISQFSGTKYVKKIIPQEKDDKIRKNNILGKNFFNVEKQKIILLKRKKVRAFERFEKCKDFLDNFRLKLIEYILNDREKNIK